MVYGFCQAVFSINYRNLYILFDTLATYHIFFKYVLVLQVK